MKITKKNSFSQNINIINKNLRDADSVYCGQLLYNLSVSSKITDEVFDKILTVLKIEKQSSYDLTKKHICFYDLSLNIISHIMGNIILKHREDYLVYGGEYMKNLLLEKNAKYGDAVLNPFCFFSNKNIIHTILSRLDEKLSRLINSNGNDDEDPYIDIMGYLYFLIIAIETGYK